MVTDFLQLINQVRKESCRSIVVAMAEDKDILVALENAREMGIAQGVLTGNPEKISQLLNELNLDTNHYEIISAHDENEAVEKALDQIRTEKAQVLMKGQCSTARFLKGILDKTTGLRTGKVLSHLAVFESPEYHKMLFMSDAAMNIAPDISDKIAITQNAVHAAHKLGYDKPKVAIISAVEKVNAESMPSSSDAAIIAKMGDRGQINNAIIDGPLAVDNALSLKSCQVKGLISPVGGDADICIVPNIETGNVFYKLLTVLGKSRVAGIVLGARVPVVLTSRADSNDAKFLSIVTALKAI